MPTAAAQDHPCTRTPATLQEALTQLEQHIDENPNELRYVDPLMRLIAVSKRAPEVLRVLFHWFTHRDLQLAAKGALIPIIVGQLRQDAQYYHPRMVGLDVTRKEFDIIHNGIKHHLDAAINEIKLLSRLQANEYNIRNSPKFIIALLKSGSSLLGVCLGNMIRFANGEKLDNQPYAYRGYPQWWRSFDWDLRAEIGADPLFERYPGGVYKGHINPLEKNVRILNLYPASRYLITLRDPRDQLVAFFCSKLGIQVKNGTLTEPLTPEQVHQQIDECIDKGLLYDALHFAACWLHLRDPERSLVVTYEDFMRQPVDTLRRVNQLYELGLADDDLKNIYDYASPVTDRVNGTDRLGHDRRVYPLGWTGRPGIHQDYFSAENTRKFLEAYNAFCRACPWGRFLTELYPELGR